MNADTITVDTEEVETFTPLADEIMESVDNIIRDNNILSPDAMIALAVDETLRTVVGWLHEQGAGTLGDLLADLGDV